MAEKENSLGRQAYKKIKSNILDLTYPPGMQLTEAKLCEDLNMSRSPVRSAIQRLRSEGLIITGYYKAITVAEITEKDVRELYQLRELIEGNAFKLIFTSGRNEEYSYRIEEKVVKMCALADDPYEWEVADTAMHMEIISIFENDRINKIYDNHLSELIRIGQYSIRNGMQIKQTNDHLKEMVQLIRDGEFEPAYRILRKDHFVIGKVKALSSERH